MLQNQNHRSFDNGLATVVLIALVAISLHDSHQAWWSLRNPHPTNYTIVQAIAYLSHFVCEAKMRKRIVLRRVLFSLTLFMSSLPHLMLWYYLPEPPKTASVDAALPIPELAFSLTVFVAIEVLLTYWVEHMNRSHRGSRK